MRRFTFTNARGDSIVLGPPPSKYLITSVSGLDMPGTTRQTQKAPGQDGETLLDETLDPRDLTFEGAITVPNLSASINPLRVALGQVLSPKLGMGVGVYEYDGGSKRIACRPDGLAFADRQREPYQRFQAKFYCPSPFWEAVEAGAQSVGLVSALLKFPVAFPSAGIAFSERLSDKARTLANAGEVDTPIRATFWGPASNPTLVNQTTGKMLHILVTLDYSESIEIDTGDSPSVILHRGSASSNGMQYLDLNSEFWRLAPGDNVVTFFDDTNSILPRCDVAWRDRFITL